MYIITEIQTNADNTIGVLTFISETWNEAQGLFHEKLAYAARSALPHHAVTLCDNLGNPLNYMCYDHEQNEE